MGTRLSGATQRLLAVFFLCQNRTFINSSPKEKSARRAFGAEALCVDDVCGLSSRFAHSSKPTSHETRMLQQTRPGAAGFDFRPR
jgi:hypothetical protein